MKRNASFVGKDNGVRDEEREDEKIGSGDKRKKSRRSSWVVGQFGEDRVKDLRKGDEEELNCVRSLGVVEKRLSEREKVREQALKLFKHRYVLDPDSTQKSNNILVTGYETSSEESAVREVIRKQSSIVISNFLDREHPVLSRLTSSEREGLERVVMTARGGRGGRWGESEHQHTHSELMEEESVGGARRKVRFERGVSLEVEGDGGRRHGHHHMIQKAGRVHHHRTKSAPSETTPIAPPPPTASTSRAVPFPYSTSTSNSGIENGSVPAPPPPPPIFQRSPSYVSAVETEDVVAMVTNEAAKPEKGRSPQQSPRTAKSTTRKKRLFTFLGMKKEKENADLAKGVADFKEEEEELTGSHGNQLLSMVAMSDVVRQRRSEEEKEECVLSPDSPKLKPIPPHTSRHLDPSQPRPSRRLKPQFSITSLPSLDPAPRKYYTPISPRVDKVTGTYASDTNPFAEDFDRSLQEQTSGHQNHAPSVTRSNTQLPDDIIADEGFQKFLEMNNAKPSTSMYITYQIQLISDKIDCKYGKQLNQALDVITPEIINNAITWENFSAICHSLMFKGQGPLEGLFMVPAFASRLLGFLPGMRDDITMFTEAVVEQYAMDWLLMRGGWVSERVM